MARTVPSAVDGDGVRAARDGQRLPDAGIPVLVEDGHGDERVTPIASTAGSRLRHRRQPSEVKTASANCACGPSGRRSRSAVRSPISGLGQDLERGVGREPQAQRGHLARERQNGDPEDENPGERDAEPRDHPCVPARRDCSRAGTAANATASATLRAAVPKPIRERPPKHGQGRPPLPLAAAHVSAPANSKPQASAAAAYEAASCCHTCRESEPTTATRTTALRWARRPLIPNGLEGRGAVLQPRDLQQRGDHEHRRQPAAKRNLEQAADTSEPALAQTSKPGSSRKACRSSRNWPRGRAVDRPGGRTSRWRSSSAG